MSMTSQPRFFFFSDMEKLGKIFPPKWKLVKSTLEKQKNSKFCIVKWINDKICWKRKFPQKWKLVKFTQGKQKNSQLYCQMNRWQNLLENKHCSYVAFVTWFAWTIKYDNVGWNFFKEHLWSALCG